MKIESYYIDGEAVDQEWIINNRELIEEGMRQDMRDHGWLPALDLPTNLRWEYDATRDVMKFRMEHKGQRVGRKRSAKSVGVLAKDGVEVKQDEGEFSLAVL